MTDPQTGGQCAVTVGQTNSVHESFLQSFLEDTARDV